MRAIRVLPMAARSALLKYLRVHVEAVPQYPSSASSVFVSSINAFRRRFSTEEVRGSFLDKSEVTDRVISVVKNFQKVDPSLVLLYFYVNYKCKALIFR